MIATVGASPALVTSIQNTSTNVRAFALLLGHMPELDVVSCALAKPFRMSH